MKCGKWVLGLGFALLISGGCAKKKTDLQANDPTPSSPSPASEGPKATFEWIQKNVLQARCQECHSKSKARGGVVLETYADVLEYLEVGNANQSYLVQLVEAGEMPKRGGKLPSAHIDAIKNWIDAGAKSE